MPPAAAHLSRRGLLAAGAIGLGALLTGCASSRDADPAPQPTNWSFVDDRQQTITLASRPQRIVAFVGTAAALRDFGVDQQVVGVFGPTTKADGSADSQAGALDIDRLAILGNVWGEFNVEKYAALNPQLLVTNMYEPDALWYVPDESKDKILALAPTAAINVARTPLITPIERYAQLAESLGADLHAATVTDAKTRFEAAAQAVTDAAKAVSGLTVMACSASADLFYVSNPKVNTDLMYFTQLGVELIVPDKLDAGGYFESLSWENADKYHADLLLLDSRSLALQPADLTSKPTWASLPAVKAGAVTGWQSEPRFSYAGSAPILEELAHAITAAAKAA